jgi:hypothetical protein
MRILSCAYTYIPCRRRPHEVRALLIGSAGRETSCERRGREEIYRMVMMMILDRGEHGRTWGSPGRGSFSYHSISYIWGRVL